MDGEHKVKWPQRLTPERGGTIEQPKYEKTWNELYGKKKNKEKENEDKKEEDEGKEKELGKEKDKMKKKEE